MESGAWGPCPYLLWIQSVPYLEHQKGNFLTLVSALPEAGALEGYPSQQWWKNQDEAEKC